MDIWDRWPKEPSSTAHRVIHANTLEHFNEHTAWSHQDSEGEAAGPSLYQQNVGALDHLKLLSHPQRLDLRVHLEAAALFPTVIVLQLLLLWE